MATKHKSEEFYDNLWETAFSGHNRFTAIAIKTTGPDSKINELVQICCFPLNANFELAKDVLPFYSDIKPIKKEVDFRYVRKDRYEELLQCSQTPQMVAELFDQWMEKKIGLPEGKKLLPLVYDWAWSRQFIRNWLGQLNFDTYFSHNYRDILSIALYLNDYADRMNRDVQYLKTTLTTLSKTLKVEYHRHNECILICKSISEVYNALMRNMY